MARWRGREEGGDDFFRYPVFAITNGSKARAVFFLLPALHH